MFPCSKGRWVFASGFCAVFLLLLCFPSVVRIFHGQFKESPGFSTTNSIREEQSVDSESLYTSVASRVCSNESDGALSARRRLYTRGVYAVISGYRVAEKSYRCLESVTLCTHGDPSYLKNLPDLALRWQGPISVSVFVTRSLLPLALDEIEWLRKCTPDRTREEIRANVTFHLVTDVPLDEFPRYSDRNASGIPCSERRRVAVKGEAPHRAVEFYPINVARNVASEAATTHFLLSADIELFPNVGFIDEFLRMVRREPVQHLLGRDGGNKTRQVFVLPIFEVAKSAALPRTKAALVDLFVEGRAVSFHKYLCEWCHRIPELFVWLFVSGWPSGGEMKVFSVVKRTGPQRYWEPIYVATKNEPGYDERLSWKGGSDKMMQMFELCAMDYDLKILNNAFLVHKVGIKRKMPRERVLAADDEKTRLVKSTIRDELIAKYGDDTDCEIVL